MIFSLSPGQAGDAPEGRRLLVKLGAASKTRNLAAKLVVPSKSSRIEPWEHDKEPCKKRNEIERLLRRLKGFRRIFTRFDTLDDMFMGFIVLALIVIAINSVSRL